MRGEAVAEDVGRHVLVDAGHCSVVGDEALNGARREFSLRAREAGAVVSPGRIFGVVEVVVEGAHRKFAKQDVSRLVAFADDSRGVFVHIEHAVGKIHKLGKTKTGGIEELHDSFVSQAFKSFLIRHGEYFLDFLQGKHGGKRFAALRRCEAGGGRGFDIPSSEMEAKEGTDGGGLSRYGLGIVVFFRDGVGKKSAQIFPLNVFKAGKLAAFVEERDEAVEIPFVAHYGPGTVTPLALEVL